MSEYCLYGFWRSSCSWRVRIALELKGLDYETVAVDLMRGDGQQNEPAFKDKSPLTQVPILEVAGEAPFRLSQSMAIMDFLERRHPSPTLWPVDERLRARATELAEMINAGIQPLQNLYVLKQLDALGRGLSPKFGGIEQAEQRKTWSKHFIERGLAAVERLAARTEGRFAAADIPTVADLCIVPQLYNARRFGLDLAAFPTLLRVESACADLPAFQRAHPDVQSDAPHP